MPNAEAVDASAGGALAHLQAENIALRERLAETERYTSLALARATRLSQIVSVLGPTDLDEVVARASVTVAELFSADIAVLMLGSDEQLDVASQWGLRPRDVPVEPFSLGPLAELTSTRPAVAGPASALALPGWLEPYRGRHAACARLLVGNQSLGLILIVRRGDVAFESSDETELQAIAYRLALSVQNGLLHNRMTAQIAQLRRMHAFTVDLAGTLEVADVAQRIADGAVNEAGVGACAVLLDDAEPIATNGGAEPTHAWARFPITTTGRRLGELAIRDEPADPSETRELLLHIVGLAGLALEKALLYERSREQARRDSLTGLLDHRTCHEALAALEKRGEPFSLVVADIDGFKQINDLYGHPAGDEALREVAGALNAEMRAGDTLYRVGGEEFCVLLPGLTAEAAFPIAERLRTRVASIIAPIRLTISLGVASFPADAGRAEEVVDRADIALYASKRAGKNQTTLAGASSPGHPAGVPVGA